MSRTLLSVCGFLLAAATAPAVSLTAYVAASLLLPVDAAAPRLGAADLPVAYVVVTLMGVIPGVVFGGLTLLAMRRTLRPWPPGAWVLAAGGGVAAALYSLVSTLAGFGPWGSSPPWRDPAAALIIGCVLVSGLVAGLIYAPFAGQGAKRG
jgi:hypothetical protein